VVAVVGVWACVEAAIASGDSRISVAIGVFMGESPILVGFATVSKHDKNPAGRAKNWGIDQDVVRGQASRTLAEDRKPAQVDCVWSGPRAGMPEKQVNGLDLFGSSCYVSRSYIARPSSIHRSRLAGFVTKDYALIRITSKASDNRAGLSPESTEAGASCLGHCAKS
jgi:hypothetical protein